MAIFTLPGKYDSRSLTYSTLELMHSSTTLDISRVSGNCQTPDSDSVAVEEPLEIRLGYLGTAGRTHKSISITMRTPGDDFELAMGFLFGEGIIREPADIESVEHCGPAVNDEGLRNVVRVELRSGVRIDFQRLERHFYTSSSCGVCGKASLEALKIQSHYSIEKDGIRIDPKTLCALPDKLKQRQQVFDRTGGLHASGLFDGRGILGEVREDVGRHNALDKLVGSLFAAGQLPLANHGILLSGRTSFELVQKAMMAGCPMLAAVGAPSSLAVELCKEFGMTLAGFLRDGRFNIYSGSHRIAGSDGGI